MDDPTWTGTWTWTSAWAWRCAVVALGVACQTDPKGTARPTA